MSDMDVMRPVTGDKGLKHAGGLLAGSVAGSLIGVKGGAVLGAMVAGPFGIIPGALLGGFLGGCCGGRLGHENPEKAALVALGAVTTSAVETGEAHFVDPHRGG